MCNIGVKGPVQIVAEAKVSGGFGKKKRGGGGGGGVEGYYIGVKDTLQIEAEGAGRVWLT